jgi:hypothetical protein
MIWLPPDYSYNYQMCLGIRSGYVSAMELYLLTMASAVKVIDNSVITSSAT